MRKENKEKEQVIHELTELRQQVDELKKAEAKRLSAGQAGKRAEEELKQKTEQQEVLLSSIPAFIYFKDTALKLIATNKAFAEMVQTPIDQLPGKDAYDLFPKEEAEKFHGDDKKVMESGKPMMNIEEEFTDAEGKTRWASTSKVPYFDEKGQAAGMVGITIDITNRKRAEEGIKRQKERAEEYLNIAGIMLATVDADENITLINKKGYEMLGYKERELMGKNWFDLLVPREIRAEVRGVFRKLVAGDIEPVEYYENPLLTKDGEERIIAFHNTVIREPNGQIIGGLFSGEDITERKRAEEELRESRRKIESLHEIACQVDACETEDDIYRLTVKAAEEILDFSTCTLDIVEDNKLVVRATSSKVSPDASRENDLDEGGLAAKTYRTGETYIFGSLDEVPEATPTREDFRSGISAPIGDIGVFQVASTEPHAFTQDDARLLELLLSHTTEVLKRIHLQNELKEQAIHDPLTGVYNRRYFTQTIESELERSKRYGHPISFLMLDVNRFKEMNDRFGHQVGDKVLQEVAKLLQGQVRESDTVIRYGGDEFLILLPETNGATEALVQRIHNAVAKWNKENLLTEFPITLSIGKSCWRPESTETIEIILRKADRRMYEDKKRHGTGNQAG